MTDSTFSVLYVDDDESSCFIVQRVLEYNDIPVSTMQDAEAALAYLAHNSPDVIILDIFLPGMDGYQALYQIRKRALACRAVAVATTAYYTAETGRDVQSWGFEGFLPKPFPVETLVPYLRSIIGKIRNGV
jgi:CheY-like chemotaxis protein